MGELREFNNYDEDIIESFQNEMLGKVELEENDDLSTVDVKNLGPEEMKAFGLVKRLNDGAITYDVFEDSFIKYRRTVEKNMKEIDSIYHYSEWLRKEALKSLKEKQ